MGLKPILDALSPPLSEATQSECNFTSNSATSY